MNGLECALRLSFGFEANKEMINDILSIASLYSSNLHTGVQDIFPLVSRYNKHLELILHKQIVLNQVYHQMLGDLQNLCGKNKKLN